VGGLKRLLDRFDRFQRSHGWLAFPVAVVKKYGDDRGGYLSALIAYYGFLSLFPLLLLMVTVLGIVLSGHPDLRASIETSALRQFPIIGPQLSNNVNAIRGSALTLAIGLIGALWGGFGVTQAIENAFDEVWGIPRRRRSNFLRARVRGLLMMLALGAFVAASTLLSAAGTGIAQRGWLGRSLPIAGTLALSVALYLVSFRVLTARDLRWAEVLPGAIVGGTSWTALQVAGGYVVQHQIRNATQLYGFFGIVLGLLFWIYLAAQLTVYAAEVNAVLKERRWPRSLSDPPPAGPATF
jgi:YihY family inner membrane protein